MSQRFSNILSGRFQQTDPREGVGVRAPEEEETGEQQAELETGIEAFEPDAGTADEMMDILSSLKSQIEELRASVESIRGSSAGMPDMSEFLTSRELGKSLAAAIDRQNVEITNKMLVNALAQISAMREDFFRLCSGMENKIDTMSAKEVLDSFRAYEVDMENILTDGGVFIGHFPYETLNTIHQRIVDVIPTADPDLNGKIAERHSDGYKLGDKVLFKEKVSVWKYVEPQTQETPSQEHSDPAEPHVTAEGPETSDPSPEPAIPVEPAAEEPEAETVPAKRIRKTYSRKRKTQR